MTDFPTAALSELCEAGRAICYGIVQPGTHIEDGVPIVRVNNFRTNHLDLNEVMRVDPAIDQKFKRSRPKPNDVLISLVGSLGQVAIAPPELVGWNLARAVGLIPIHDPHKAQWVFFALQAPEAQQFIRSHANTTVQATFNLGDLSNLSIPYPDRPEREAILSVLSTLDDKIELNRRMNETLEALAQAIFKDWFVDFGPTRRKSEGATDPVAILGNLIPNPDRAKEAAALFPASFGDDGLPEGWQENPFSSLVEIIGGGTPKTSDPSFWNGDIPWFSVTDTPTGSDTFVFETEKNITVKGLAGSSARMIDAGTSIITARGTVGNLAIAGRDMTFNQSCYALKSAVGVLPYFVYVATGQIVERLKSNAHGSVFSTITRQTFESVSFIAPPIEARKAYEEVAAPLFQRVSAAVQENRALAETRDYLLPKLMSGEVRVRDVEKIAG